MVFRYHITKSHRLQEVYDVFEPTDSIHHANVCYLPAHWSTSKHFLVLKFYSENVVNTDKVVEEDQLIQM